LPICFKRMFCWTTIEISLLGKKWRILLILEYVDYFQWISRCLKR
jgi:hypothetical protein